MPALTRTTADLAVRLTSGARPTDVVSALPGEVADLRGRPVAEQVAWAADVGDRLPRPGRGDTARLWEVLATVGAADLVAARVLEPHLDALGILDELDPSAAEDPAPRTYGVWAAEGADPRLEARPDDAGAWTLTGLKPWCSLAGDVSHALVTAWLAEGGRGLFSVALDDPGVEVTAGRWSGYALAEVVTSTVRMTGVVAQPVGPPGWYLARDGFAWGGIGVAAVWYGGAVGVARRLLAQADRKDPDQVGQMHLGAVDAALTAARAVLAEAAAAVDDGRAAGSAGVLLASRVRQVVADTVDVVLTRAAHGLGPGPLAHEPEHARRVADLGLYVRQHHAERDQAALGRAVLETGETW